MSYTVRFTESNNPTKVAKVVEDQTLNTETSVTFVGKNYAGYAAYIAENFLHILENFANGTAPLNPVEGQLWFDNSPGTTQLKVWDGSVWTETGGVKKGAASPTYKTIGDLWVDTENQQLKVWTGSTWVLVGPQYSAGSKTGFEVETISDLLDVPHSVLSCYVANTRLMIISNTTFTPKGTVDGFSTIKPGVNITTNNLGTTLSPTYAAWNGTANKANALVINGVDVASTNFLRGDTTSTSGYNLYIKNDGGVTVGSDLRLSLQVDGNAGVIYNSVAGSSIDLNVNNAGSTATVIRVDSSKNVGINKTNPTEALDISGNVLTDGKVSITGTLDASNLTTASLVTQGGAAINKKLIVGDDTTINGTINISPTGSVAMLPSTTEAYDLGSSTKKFNNVYAKTFVGSFSGSFSGTLGTGTTSQYARQLLDSTSFSIGGDVLTTVPVVFNGVTENQTATFNTVISETFFTRQTDITTSSNTDQFLIYRPGTGIRKTTKETFFNSVATVPVGGIMPFAGAVSAIPKGFLLCDGAEIPRSVYGQLFAIIGYTYKDLSLLKGYQSFALPDLRGRFPLGKDNMENLDGTTNLPLQIKTKASGEAEAAGTGTAIYTDAGGGAANNVTSTAGSTLGANSGKEAVTLAVNNLPDHRHNMRGRRPDGTVGQQYYAYRNATGTPTDVDARLDVGATASNSAHYLPHSGNVDAPLLGQPVDSMNPYLTINYIIYTGVLA